MSSIGCNTWIWASSLSDERLAVLAPHVRSLGFDVIEAQTPALVSVTAAADEPRYPTLKGIMGAKAKPLEELSLKDLEIDPDSVAALQQVVGLEAAPQKPAGRTIEDDGTAASQIADLLSEAKVI